MEESISPEGMHGRELITKRLKRKKRKRIILKTIVILLLLVSIGTAGFIVVKKIEDKTFYVKHIMVVGNETVNSKTVREAARIPVDTCIFTLNMNQIYQNVSERIDSRQLLISKKYPDTIMINIAELPVFFAILENDQVYYLDENNRIIEKSDCLTRTDIPVVTGLSGLSETEVGMSANLKPSSVANEIMKMITILTNSGYTERLSEIVVDSDRTILLITKNNLVIHIKDLEQFKKNYDYIGSIISKNKSNMVADLTLGEEVIVKNR